MGHTLTEVSKHHPAAAHCAALYEVRDEGVGLHAFIALHDLGRGPGYGGIRRRAYGSVREAVSEVVSLAEQMTLKTAFAGLPAGGAKAVILDREGLDRGAIYESFGRAVEELGGAFFAGPDVGTSDDELARLRQTSGFVSGAAANARSSAAIGVVAACREAMAHLGVERSTAPVDALVVGVGSVGRLVAEGLAAAGLSLAVSDLDPAREEEVAALLSAIRVPAAEALARPTSLLVPCGVNPVVTTRTVGAFAARIICGAANHQLEVDHLAHELDERKVLYVPDFAANAGAVIEGVLRHTTPAGEDPDARIAEALAMIGPRIRRLLEDARTHDITPLEVALASIDLTPHH